MTITIGNHPAIEDFLARLEKSGKHLSMATLQILSLGKEPYRGANNRPGSFEEEQEKKRHKSFASNTLNLPEKSICKIKISIAEDGYLHLFDLGTSGTCKKIFPMEGEHNFFHASGNIILPSEMPGDVIKIGVTDDKELGFENRLLLIFTQNNKNLSVQNLDSAILERPRTITLRGCRDPFNNDFLPDDEDLMDHLDGETWSYDLIRFTIN